MLDQIVNLIKDQAQDHFINNTEVPNEQAEQTAQAAGESMMDILNSGIAGGNLDAIKGLLGGGGAGNSNLVQDMISQLSGKISQNSGLNAEQANQAASGIMPQLIEKVAGKFASQDDADADFNIESLISNVGQGAAIDKAKDLLGGFLNRK